TCAGVLQSSTSSHPIAPRAKRRALYLQNRQLTSLAASHFSESRIKTSGVMQDGCSRRATPAIRVSTTVPATPRRLGTHRYPRDVRARLTHAGRSTHSRSHFEAPTRRSDQGCSLKRALRIPPAPTRADHPGVAIISPPLAR